MTTPTERYAALVHTRQFIFNVMIDMKLPAELRETAFRLLKHYPTAFYLDELAKLAPQLLEVSHENSNRI